MQRKRQTPDWFGPELPRARRFALYLPTKRRDGQPLDGIERVAEATTKLLAQWFGGVTAFPATGTFVNADGAETREEILVLESFCYNEAWAQHNAEARSLAMTLVGLLEQDSIACLLDGNMICVQAGGAILEIPLAPGKLTDAALAGAVEAGSRK